MKVLNIAHLIPVEGLPPDNDIALKIYADLFKQYGIYSEFVKSVGNIPELVAILKRSLRIRRDIFSRLDYINPKHNIRIHFYKGTFPLIARILPFNTDFLLPLQFKYYKRSLINVVSIYNPNLIHAHTIFPDGYYALELHKRYNIPYILTIRGPLYRLYYEKKGQEILRHAASITTPSWSLWNGLNKSFRIDLIPHGLDDCWYVDEQRMFNPGTLCLVTVSRLLKMKNIQLVLRVMAGLIQKGYRVTYDIIGEGEYREQLVNLAKELNIHEFVRFHGFQSGEYIRNVYKRADIFIMLSYPETFGMSYFEAAAQGLYIIGVKNTGAYGHFTEEEATFIDIDESQLAETLKKMDSDEFVMKTSKMRMKIQAFRNSEIIERYYEILCGAAGRI